jgi:RNA recognition motif-containing protein
VKAAVRNSGINNGVAHVSAAGEAEAAQTATTAGEGEGEGSVDPTNWRSTLSKEYKHGHVPKNVDLAKEFNSTVQTRPPTTLMIRNIPNRYSQRELIQELEDLGFPGTFDFLYMPLDKGTMSNVGYAFVNFVEHASAVKCIEVFKEYHFKRHRKISGKMAAVSVAHIQGLEANLAHYENAAVNTAKLKQHRPVVMANISQQLVGVA